MSTGNELPLFRSPMLCCPWCETWNHREAYIVLQIPDQYEKQLIPIYKCPETGCKMLFAYDTLR